MKNQTLGTMIASLRKENGMTQAELADKMGVTDKAVSKWERDLSCPDVSSLPRLAEIYGISVDQLMQPGSKTDCRHERKSTDEIMTLLFKAVALAMGVSVMVLSILKEIDLYTGFFLLGLGLTCVGILLLSRRHNED